MYYIETVHSHDSEVAYADMGCVWGGDGGKEFGFLDPRLKFEFLCFFIRYGLPFEKTAKVSIILFLCPAVKAYPTSTWSFSFAVFSSFCFHLNRYIYSLISKTLLRILNYTLIISCYRIYNI